MLSGLRRLLGRENGGHPENRGRQKESAFKSQRKILRSKLFWQEQRDAVDPLSDPMFMKPVMKDMETLTTELQLMTKRRNDLQERLISVIERTVDNRPYPKPNPLYEQLKSEHDEVMMQLKRLEEENTKVSQKFSELTKETVFYRGLHSQLLMQETQLEKKVDMLRQEKKKLLEEWVLLKPHLEDWKMICKDKEEDTSDLKIQQQQELKRLEERLQFLLKQKEVITPEKDMAENLQHQFEASKMRSKKLQTDLEQATAQDESHLLMELLEPKTPAEPTPSKY
ncbi:Disks large homolog 5 [Lemmus lemmus]